MLPSITAVSNPSLSSSVLFIRCNSLSFRLPLCLHHSISNFCLRGAGLQISLTNIALCSCTNSNLLKVSVCAGDCILIESCVLSLLNTTLSFTFERSDLCAVTSIAFVQQLLQDKILVVCLYRLSGALNQISLLGFRFLFTSSV